MYCLFTGYFYDVVFNFARYSVPPKYDFLHLFAFYFVNLLVSTFYGYNGGKIYLFKDNNRNSG